MARWTRPCRRPQAKGRRRGQDGQPQRLLVDLSPGPVGPDVGDPDPDQGTARAARCARAPGRSDRSGPSSRPAALPVGLLEDHAERPPGQPPPVADGQAVPRLLLQLQEPAPAARSASGTERLCQRAAAVPRFGLKGNTCMWRNPTRRATSSVARKSSSVSPGKPAITSVVIAGGRSSAAAERRLDPLDHLQVVADAVLPVHPPQHAVRARLERQVQVGHDDRCVRDHRVEQRRRHVAGLHRADAEPLQAGHLRDGVEEVRERRRSAETLAAPQGRLVAVGAPRKMPVSTSSR